MDCKSTTVLPGYCFQPTAGGDPVPVLVYVHMGDGVPGAHSYATVADPSTEINPATFMGGGDVVECCCNQPGVLELEELLVI